MNASRAQENPSARNRLPDGYTVPAPIRRDPPAALNVVLSVSCVAVYAAALWGATHLEGWPAKIACIAVFAAVGNTLFALLHEAVHGILSKRYWVNESFGQLVAMCFPTGLRFQRTCHLGHHLRNRTDHEIFDMYYPGDNRFLKNLQFYSILTGPYWLSVSVGWMLYLVFPWFFRIFTLPMFQKEKSTDAAMMLPFLDHPAKYRIRAELLLTVAFQAGLWLVLDLAFWPTFACFWTFGVVWGSLQYADHAWTPRDVRAGAWNLKVNPVTRWIFLNYHFHQVHHIHPRMPWLYLPEHVDPRFPQPSFLRIYLEMWKGPKPVDSPPPAAVDDAFHVEVDEHQIRNSPDFVPGKTAEA